MSALPTPTDDSEPLDTWPVEAQHYREILQDFGDMAHAVGRVLHRRIIANAEAAEPADPTEPAPPPPLDPVLNATADTFERVYRGARRGIALAHRLAESAPPSTAQRHAAARRRIIREVEDTIHRRVRRPGDKQLLDLELRERLDSPDLAEDIDNRPIPEIIVDICRDLGIGRDLDVGGPLPWRRRTPEDIADLCAQAHPSPVRQTRPGPPGAPERVHRLSAIPDSS